jgi:hypothetical protein
MPVIPVVKRLLRHSLTSPPPARNSALTTHALCHTAGIPIFPGGSAVAEWLESNLMDVVSKNWAGRAPEADITEAYLQADSKLLVAKGFMGMGE